MIRYLIAVAFVLLSTALAAPQRVVFEGAESDHKWTLKELNPELPSDWSGYQYLVLEMKASSPQRFWLTLHTPEGAQRRQMHPLSNVWIRAAVPLQYYRQPNARVMTSRQLGRCRGIRSGSAPAASTVR